MDESKAWYDTIGHEALASWIASRPKVIRDLLSEFPYGSSVKIKDKTWIIFGANEGGQLIMVPSDSRNYDEAMQRRTYLCADHLRRGEVHFEQQR